jgi:HEAT repeat protein
MEPITPPDPAIQFEGTEAIPMLVARLSIHSPVRRLAEAVLGQTHQALDNIQPLFTTLAHPEGHSWRERLVAAWALGRVPLTPQEQDAAAGMLLDVLGSRPRVRSWRAIMQGIVLSYVSAFPFCLLGAMTQDDFITMEVIIGTLGALLGGIPVALWWGKHQVRNANRLRAMAALTLGRLQVPESIGDLAGAAFDRSPQVREAASSALHEVLPILTSAHYGLFGAVSIENLGNVLSHPDALLVSRTLTALKNVGTSHAIPYVERVAAQGRTALLRDKAHDVLAVLRERQHQEEQAQTLMRASIAPPTPSGLLLRPAQGVSESDPQQLLRSSDLE